MSPYHINNVGATYKSTKQTNKQTNRQTDRHIMFKNENINCMMISNFHTQYFANCSTFLVNKHIYDIMLIRKIRNIHFTYHNVTKTNGIHPEHAIHHYYV